MSEWLKEHAWKACVGETLPRVRIPLSPPVHKQLNTDYLVHVILPRVGPLTIGAFVGLLARNQAAVLHCITECHTGTCGNQTVAHLPIGLGFGHRRRRARWVREDGMAGFDYARPSLVARCVLPTRDAPTFTTFSPWIASLVACPCQLCSGFRSAAPGWPGVTTEDTGSI